MIEQSMPGDHVPHESKKQVLVFPFLKFASKAANISIPL